MTTMIEMQSVETGRRRNLLYTGRILFSTQGWEGMDDSGIDFPLILAQLGLVPVMIRSDDLVNRYTEVTYRWVGFPRVSDTEAIPEYRVTVAIREIVENGRTVRDIYMIDFRNDNIVIRALRSFDNASWIINPTPEEVGAVTEQGLVLASPSAVATGERQVVPTRRIVVNR